MSDVQLKNGWTRIVNGLLEALAMYDFTGQERKFLDAVIRLSYGCGKYTATFPSWSNCEVFGLPRQCLLSTRRKQGILDRLRDANVILVDYETKTVAIQKHYTKWKIRLKDVADKKKFKALIDFNLKCKLQLTNVSSGLQPLKPWCKPQLTRLSATAYKLVSYSLQSGAVNPHGSKPEVGRKERKESKERSRATTEGSLVSILKQEGCQLDGGRRRGFLTKTEEEVNDAIVEVQYFEENAAHLFGFSQTQARDAIQQYGRGVCLEAIEEYSKTATERVKRNKPIQSPVPYFFGICKRLVQQNGGKRY